MPLYDVYAVMHRWHDLKLPRRPYLDFMRKREWTSLQYASTDSILCGRPVDDWYELREVGNTGEASLYLEI